MWKTVDVDGNLRSLARGNRAGRVEKEKRGDLYEAKIGRRRGQPPRTYWTWESVGRFGSAEQAQAAVEELLPPTQ